jgi:hypothetical protein
VLSGGAVPVAVDGSRVTRRSALALIALSLAAAPAGAQLLALTPPGRSISDPQHPETSCAANYVETNFRHDVSARTLATLIADRCSEKIRSTQPPCVESMETVDGALCRRRHQAEREAAAQISGLLVDMAYELIVGLRQINPPNRRRC